MNTFDKVYQVVKKIPQGKVMAYGQIAEITGTNPRVVGYALHANKNPKEIPCHRVVHKNGGLAGGFAFGGPSVQKKILKKEGVQFIDNDTVDMAQYIHQ